MKAVTAGIPGDERVEVLRYCWLSRDDVRRLDALLHKVRSRNGKSTGRIHPAALFYALLLSGLERAESKAQTLDVSKENGERCVYSLTLDDVERLKRLRQSLWPARKGRPFLERLHVALIRLALQAAETNKSFARKLTARALRASEAA